MKKAVVLLSGGLDSTVTIAVAISAGLEVIPLTINYGQRHMRELRAAKEVVKFYNLENHVIIDLDLTVFKTSALTSPDFDVPEGTGDDLSGTMIPVTYVPSRNIIFLGIAAGLCESESAEKIFIGANSIDYSGYPDCRPEFLEAFQKTLEVGTKAGIEGRPLSIEAPLLYLTKADIVGLGKRLGAPLHLTWSCYKGGVKACGRCDSCLLRLRGFREAGYEDEIAYEVRS
ncbi:MAG: 7-cyano-7-deazaguanine synthase QueC [Methanomassiliicoccales archaeon]|nr:7-cyano-7-deazaguanine synthase QueC [Methanomassiliicoccales archaeon]